MLRLQLASMRPLANRTALSSLKATHLNVAKRQFSTNGFFRQGESKMLSKLNLKSPFSWVGVQSARGIMTQGPQIIQKAPGISWQRLAITAAGVAGTVFVIDSFLNRETRDSLSAGERSLLNESFKYTGGGLLLTAAAARGLFKSGFAFRVMAANPWVVLGVSLVGSIGTMMGTLYTPPEKTVQKHLFWLGFNACQAATLSPLFFFSPAILARAALYTVGVVGAISYVGATATNDKYLHLGGPLLAGVTVVALSSLAPMVLPVGMRGLALAESISLYGGLAVFGGFVLYDTQKILQHGRLAERGLMKPDPINESVSLELDMINIFIRLVQILSMQNNRRK
ncbi:inhibitor of apoptosis-promoting Bax1-domain-containing protein [Panaeolus papilionaceus]|nr:inhibitor of apoptosis-promoting Bax1-domain-containing protein [Panaeolus papilionaceus]